MKAGKEAQTLTLIPTLFHVIFISDSVRNQYTNEEKEGEKRESYYYLRDLGESVKRAGNVGREGV